MPLHFTIFVVLVMVIVMSALKTASRARPAPLNPARCSVLRIGRARAMALANLPRLLSPPG
jgi:hypothetical protein